MPTLAVGMFAVSLRSLGKHGTCAFMCSMAGCVGLVPRPLRL